MSHALALDFEHPPADPVNAFLAWYDEARRLPLPNTNSMYLATVDIDGRPSVRTVLLKTFDADGAVFFTNRQSRKGLGLDEHRHAALLFHWDQLDRQVRIEGEVRHTSDADSDAYFASRPRSSQVNAWASEQSRPVKDRAALEGMAAEVERRFDGKPIPRPPHWGGYRVALDRIEFWQGDKFRLHDRIVYTRDSVSNHPGGFVIERLCP
ncbi:MAG: pyridoxamine 5'-phosphate oxidase [Phycisphaerae bacterium]|nr:pyridoxamine 5'-phosphate oxidase [Phycisphaerae bacterium]